MKSTGAIPATRLLKLATWSTRTTHLDATKNHEMSLKAFIISDDLTFAVFPRDYALKMSDFTSKSSVIHLTDG